ncbi:radical SAM-superfamily [Candidatus Gastranaerophilus sp. (ex Termes propinquus)]|nr:radical SAM-superfamily [Candidatus Gastranaerophilus sp. (ex Termes propinquus)]
MNILLLFPPQWTPISPYFALPSLLGQLLAAGYSAKAVDLNIEFYNDILNKKNVESALIKAKESLPVLLKEISKHHTPSKKAEEYPFEIQNMIAKYGIIKKFEATENVADLIDGAKEVLKTEKFYDPKLFTSALYTIDKALEIISLPYAPSKLSFASYDNPFFKLNWESIKYWTFDANTNIFLDYFENKIDKLLCDSPEYIGISINSSTQIVPGFTLAHLIKKRSSKAHLNIGGNFFGRVIENVAPEFFELFCDSILVEEGERPAVELAKHIEGKLSIGEVSNLVYLKDGVVKTNGKATPPRLDEIAPVSLDGYNLESYFTPEIVMPHQTSKGCYWGKCSFCDQDFGQNFNIKNTDKLVLELEELKNKYGISSFEFIDESVAPAYLEELARKILDKGLSVDYFSNARLESAFTYDILKKARASGLRMLLWGLESGSLKIMELINKGIDLKKRFDILKDSSNADIWNFAFIFFGFPAETREDAEATIDMLCKHSDIIDSYGRSVFTMGKHTKLKDMPQEYGIVSVMEQQDELSPSLDFVGTGMGKAELSELIKQCTKSCAKAYSNPLWMYLRYREFLFLYIKKYGSKWVKVYNMEAE